MRFEGKQGGHEEELGIGGEEDIDDCDSIHGEEVSKELISVVINKEVPIAVVHHQQQQEQQQCVFLLLFLEIQKTKY
jgi:hypothetical protein